MANKRVRLLTLSEFAVVLGVAGILASIAIPSYVRMKSHSRFENLLESVRSCQEEIPQWLRTSVSNGGAESDAGADGRGIGTKMVAADEKRISGQDREGTKTLHNVQTGRE
jgi:Tfp pilus assembly major pilin PilA